MNDMLSLFEHIRNCVAYPAWVMEGMVETASYDTPNRSAKSTTIDDSITISKIGVCQGGLEITKQRLTIVKISSSYKEVPVQQA
jgi:hypothetical protein